MKYFKTKYMNRVHILIKLIKVKKNNYYWIIKYKLPSKQRSQ